MKGFGAREPARHVRIFRENREPGPLPGVQSRMAWRPLRHFRSPGRLPRVFEGYCTKPSEIKAQIKLDSDMEWILTLEAEKRGACGSSRSQKGGKTTKGEGEAPSRPPGGTLSAGIVLLSFLCRGAYMRPLHQAGAFYVYLPLEKRGTRRVL